MKPIKKQNFILLSSLIGFLVCIIILIGNKIAPYIFSNFILFLWPGSILLLGAGGIQKTGELVLVYSITIASNIFLFAFLGYLIWTGINKKRWVLMVASLIICVIWVTMARI